MFGESEYVSMGLGYLIECVMVKVLSSWILTKSFKESVIMRGVFDLSVFLLLILYLDVNDGGFVFGCMCMVVMVFWWLCNWWSNRSSSMAFYTYTFSLSTEMSKFLLGYYVIFFMGELWLSVIIVLCFCLVF